MGIGDWGLGIGDWGLGIGPNPQSPIPIPNPQSPIPNPPSPFDNRPYKKKQNYNKEITSIIKDKTEDIINFLWNLVDKKLKEKDQDNSAKGDVLVNILKDDHKKNSPSKNDSRERSHDYK